MPASRLNEKSDSARAAAGRQAAAPHATVAPALAPCWAKARTHRVWTRASNRRPAIGQVNVAVGLLPVLLGTPDRLSP
jgi:hypothetical protein